MTSSITEKGANVLGLKVKSNVQDKNSVQDEYKNIKSSVGWASAEYINEGDSGLSNEDRYNLMLKLAESGDLYSDDADYGADPEVRPKNGKMSVADVKAKYGKKENIKYNDAINQMKAIGGSSSDKQWKYSTGPDTTLYKNLGNENFVRAINVGFNQDSKGNVISFYPYAWINDGSKVVNGRTEEQRRLQAMSFSTAKEAADFIEKYAEDKNKVKEHVKFGTKMKVENNGNLKFATAEGKEINIPANLIEHLHDVYQDYKKTSS